MGSAANVQRQTQPTRRQPLPRTRARLKQARDKALAEELAVYRKTLRQAGLSPEFDTAEARAVLARSDEYRAAVARFNQAQDNYYAFFDKQPA